MISEEIYKENILDHFQHPRNKCAMAHCTISQREFNPLCGDDLTVYILIEDNRIQKISFTGTGCAISQAAVSMLTEEVTGKKQGDALMIKEQEVYRLLGIPISHTRKKCALLGLNALQKALRRTEHELTD